MKFWTNIYQLTKYNSNQLCGLEIMGPQKLQCKTFNIKNSKPLTLTLRSWGTQIAGGGFKTYKNLHV